MKTNIRRQKTLRIVTDELLLFHLTATNPSFYKSSFKNHKEENPVKDSPAWPSIQNHQALEEELPGVGEPPPSHSHLQLGALLSTSGFLGKCPPQAWAKQKPVSQSEQTESKGLLTQLSYLGDFSRKTAESKKASLSRAYPTVFSGRRVIDMSWF